MRESIPLAKREEEYDGPSMRTRTSLTSVATWPDSMLTGNAAANTCGTAYTLNPASTPY